MQDQNPRPPKPPAPVPYTLPKVPWVLTDYDRINLKYMRILAED